MKIVIVIVILRPASLLAPPRDRALKTKDRHCWQRGGVCVYECVFGDNNLGYGRMLFSWCLGYSVVTLRSIVAMFSIVVVV